VALQVIYTPRFKQTIRLLFDSVPDYYRESTLIKLFNKIDEYKTILTKNPLLGQIEPGFEDMDRIARRIVIKPYFKLIYNVSDNYVALLDIWDTRMNPSILMQRVINQ